MMKAIGVLVSLVLATGVEAQSLKEKYELSVQCGKQAAQRFEEFALTIIPSPGNRYESHYNSRLNKCFLLKMVGEEYQAFSLEDVNENKEVGNYFVKHRRNDKPLLIACRVQEKKCTSEEEFRALIKPFMED
jgi:hypothetical protein